MQPRLVDIVLATNRASPFLPQTLASVRAQTLQDWRLIVVDDGSADPLAVAALLADMPRTTIIRQSHRGLPASRNVGIGHGEAPFIALLDDDDIWHDEKLAAQVQALSAHPEALASFTAGRYIDTDGLEFGSGWPATTVSSDRFVTGEEPQPRIVSLMVRRSANALIGGFNESYSLAEDNEYILRLVLAGQLVADRRPLVSYRRHGNNMSSSGSLEGRRANLRLLHELREAYAANPTVRGQLSQRLDRFLDESAMECVRGTADAFRHRDHARLAAEMRWAFASPGRTLRATAKKFTSAR